MENKQDRKSATTLLDVSPMYMYEKDTLMTRTHL